MMMPPPPPDLFGGAPPGGGPPAAQPTPAGPRGTVPEVSNERRPGLTYNASMSMDEAREALANTMGAAITLDDLAKRTSGWPEDMRKRAVDIWNGTADEITVGEPEEAFDRLASETDDPETWALKSNQRVEQVDGQSIIVEGANRLSLPVEAGKRYALIDPMADALEESESVEPPAADTQSAR